MTIIHIPNRNIIYPDDPIQSGTEMAGWYKIEKLKVDAHGVPIEASRAVAADWFPNIITDQGLNRIGTANDWLNACQVGTGTAAPATTNTGLASFLAGTTTQQATTTGAQASAPFFSWTRRTFRFAAGVATGVISEVGVGWASTGATLYSRALILDGAQNPTTITVLSDEVLDVTYEHRVFAPASDVMGNITITGVGSVATTTRASNVTSNSAWTGGASLGGIGPSVAFHTVHSGAIGAVTGQPSGSQSGATSAVLNAYSNNSYQRSGVITFGLNEGNIGGIRSLLATFGDRLGGFALGTIQTEFGTIIPKTAAQTLTLNVNHVWSRRP